MKKRKTYDTYFDIKKIPQKCMKEGCDEKGLYPAPKFAIGPRVFYWYCLEHVKNYNAQWNFQTRATEEGGYDQDFFQSDAQDVHDFLRSSWSFAEDNTFQNYGTTKEETPEQKALAIMGLSFPFTKEMLKKSFKERAKKYHPDLRNNDPYYVEKFKEINEAYDLLNRLSETFGL